MQKIENLLSTNLLKEAGKRDKVDKHLQYYLPDDMSMHIRVISLKHAKLTIMVDSNAWASKVRYLQKEIIKSFQSDPEYFVQTLTIKVGQWTVAKKDTAPPELSEGAKKSISTAAKEISDPDLKATFNKFIKD